MKPPAHGAELPGNDSLFNIVPLDPAHRAGLAGHAPVKIPPQTSPGPQGCFRKESRPERAKGKSIRIFLQLRALGGGDDCN
jgi:hypothetical protein